MKKLSAIPVLLGLSILAIAGLALIAFLVLFLGLFVWALVANFWALGIAGMAIVALVIVTLYVVGSSDDDSETIKRPTP